MTLIKLISLLCILESSNNPEAIGDGGRAVGILQIHSIMVRECNRLSTKFDPVFKDTDRLNVMKSKRMATIFFFRRVEDRQNLTEAEIEECVKAWNGGPSWRKGKPRKQSNLTKYFNRFKELRK